LEEVEQLQIRVHGGPELPTLIYLPGLHGDWTLAGSFRSAIKDQVQFVEFTYPRSLEWRMDDYARGIQKALFSHGITHGWLLGESFGSQVGWALVEHSGSAERFKVDRFILAGGFVKHPWTWGPGLLRSMLQGMTMTGFKVSMRIYASYARLRRLLEPEIMQGVAEFIARRNEMDRRAMRNRLTLLDEFDPRPIARRTRVPIHYLAGFADPIVPWPVVRRWLRENCPAYAGGKTLWLGDHNVLATQPERSARQVWEWMKPGAVE
jgi:pimeloyl-ACP methyl ester carboxylesterase